MSPLVCSPMPRIVWRRRHWLAKYDLRGAAAVGGFVDVLLKERGLYKPTALLNWTAQVRAVTIAWIGVFMFLAGSVFALKIGSTFSRVTITSFATMGLCGLIAHRVLWRTVLEKGMASGSLTGRSIVLISENQPALSLQQILLRHGFRVQSHLVLSTDRSHPSHWDDVISEAIACARRSNVDEVFIAADYRTGPTSAKRWSAYGCCRYLSTWLWLVRRRNYSSGH